MTKHDKEKLLNAARQASKNSYSPYSGFAVGAAVLTANNKIFSGTNIENSSYSLTMCAERVALYAALTAGEKDITAMALSARSKTALYPCGACLQVISELAGDIPLITDSIDNEPCIYSLSELLPRPFDKSVFSCQKR